MPEINIIISSDKDAEYSEFRQALLKSIADSADFPYGLITQNLDSTADLQYLHNRAELTQYRQECRNVWQKFQSEVCAEFIKAFKNRKLSHNPMRGGSKRQKRRYANYKAGKV